MDAFEDQLREAIGRMMRGTSIPDVPVEAILDARSVAPAHPLRPRRRVPWTASAAAFFALAIVSALLWQSAVRHRTPSHPVAASVLISGKPLPFPAKQLVFVSLDVGFALAVENSPAQDTGPVVVYRTADAGRTWSRLFSTPLTTSAPVALRSVGTSDVVLVGLPGIAYVFPDAGGAPHRTPLPAGTLGVDSVSFATGTTWYALVAGGSMNQWTGTVYRSPDAGRTWSVAQTFRGAFPTTGLVYSAGVLWIGQIPPNPGSAALITLGKNASKAVRIPLGSAPLRTAQLAAGPPTFFSAADGLLPIVPQGPATIWLAATRDGGAHWSTPVRLPGQTYALVDERHIVATQGNLFYTSADRGRHWTTVQLPKGLSVLSLDFSDPRNGWAIVRYRGALHAIRTQDGGLDWSSP